MAIIQISLLTFMTHPYVHPLENNYCFIITKAIFETQNNLKRQPPPPHSIKMYLAFCSAYGGLSELAIQINTVCTEVVRYECYR